MVEPFKINNEIKMRPGLTKLDESVVGVDQSLWYLLNYINNDQNGGFDGFIGFSQGTIVI